MKLQIEIEIAANIFILFHFIFFFQLNSAAELGESVSATTN
jgi:hypothetical protein